MLFDLIAKVEGRLDLLDNLVHTWSRAGVDVSMYDKSRIQATFLTMSRRTYWTRLWVIQEILSASSIDLLYGVKTIPWAHFSRGLAAIGNIVHLHGFELEDSCAKAPAYAIAAKHSYENFSYSIEDLVSLCSACDSQCEDIRDRIYGPVSLADTFKIAPDYSKSALEVYIEIFRIYYFCSEGEQLGLYHIQFPTVSHMKWNAFVKSVEVLLGFPLWDHDGKCFFALQHSNHMPLCRNLATVSLHATIRTFAFVDQISPVLQSTDDIDMAVISHFDTSERWYFKTYGVKALETLLSDM